MRLGCVPLLLLCFAAGCSTGSSNAGERGPGPGAWRAKANVACKRPFTRLSQLQAQNNDATHTAGAIDVVLPKLRNVHPPDGVKADYQSFLDTLAAERDAAPDPQATLAQWKRANDLADRLDLRRCVQPKFRQTS